MTTNDNQGAADRSKARPSLLPFDPADLVAMRVLPAEYARMVGVSRQTVSRWIHSGKVTLGPDGRLEPNKASREVIANTDPARLRAQAFRGVTATHAELRERIKALEADRAGQAERERAITYREQDAAAQQLGRFIHAVVQRFDEARAAQEAGRLDAWLDDLAGLVIYGQEPDGGGRDSEPADRPHVPTESDK